MRLSGRGHAALLWGMLVLLLLYAAAGLVVPLVPRGIMIEWLGSIARSGETAAEVTAHYEALVSRARITSALLLLGWGLLVWQRRRLGWLLGRFVVQLAHEIAMAPRRVLAAARTALRRRPVESLVFLVILLVGVGLRLHDSTRLANAWTMPLALLYGAGSIPAGYALGRALGGPGVGAIAAAMIAGASVLVEASVDARAYGALAFFSLLLLWAGQSAIRTGAVPAWGLAILAAVCGFYQSLVMVLPGIAAFAWFFGLAVTRPVPWRNQAIRHVVLAGLGAGALTVFLYVPILTVSGWDGLRYRQGSEALGWMPLLLGPVADWGRGVWSPLAVAALALAAPLLARRSRGALSLLLAGIAAALLLQSTLLRGSGVERVWLPILAVLAAASLDGVVGRLGRAGSGSVALALLWAMVLGMVW